MPNAGQKIVPAEEVLVFDSSTLVAEIGLMSNRGSALKHYLYSRGIKLIVPAVVAKECERHLIQRARGKRSQIQDNLEWLARFCRKVGGWSAPSDNEIGARAKALSTGDDFGAIVLPETEAIRERAEFRERTERPPGHSRAGLADCKIWEQCLDLLTEHDVILVSADTDFRGHHSPDELHPQLRTEAEEVGAGRKLTFLRTIVSLLRDLKSEIPSIPNDVIFKFIYDASRDVIQELESNCECQPTSTGTIKQTRLTTEAPDVIEVRLEVEDTWENADRATSLPFKLTGSCHYYLRDKRLADLKTDVVRLSTTEPDGSVRSVKGSHVNVQAHFYAGTPPIRPERGTLE